MNQNSYHNHHRHCHSVTTTLAIIINIITPIPTNTIPITTLPPSSALYHQQQRNYQQKSLKSIFNNQLHGAWGTLLTVQLALAILHAFWYTG